MFSLKTKTLRNVLSVLLLLLILVLPFNKSLTRSLSYITIGFFFLLMGKGETTNFPLKLPLIVFGVTFALTLPFGSDFYFSQKFFFSCFLAYLFLFRATWEVSFQKNYFHVCVIVFILAAMVVAVDAYYQLVVGQDFVFANQVMIRRQSFVNGALTGPFGHFSQLGEFIGSVLLGIIMYAIITPRFIVRWILLFVSLLLAPPFILTYSRGSWASFMISLIVLIGAAAFLKKNSLRKNMLSLASLVIFPAMVFGILSLYFPELRQRFYLLIIGDPAGRYGIWRETISLIKDTYLTGVGLNRIPYFINTKVDAHNIFLKVLGDTGIAGFFGFSYFLWSYGKTLMKNVHQAFVSDSSRLPEIVFFLGMILFIFIHNMTDVSIIDGWNLGIFFWVSAGFLYKITGECDE